MRTLAFCILSFLTASFVAAFDDVTAPSVGASPLPLGADTAEAAGEAGILDLGDGRKSQSREVGGIAIAAGFVLVFIAFRRRKTLLE